MAVSIRPLTLGEILDRTVQLYRRNFPLFLGISTLPAAIDVLISGGAGIFFTSRIGQITPKPGGQPIAMNNYLTFFAVAAALALVGVPLLLGVFSVALAALNRAAFALNEGQTITVRRAYSEALKHFWRYVGILSLQFLFAALIPGVAIGGLFSVVAVAGAVLVPKTNGNVAVIAVGLITIALMLLLAAACIWIWIRYCLAFSTSIVEDTRVWPSMKRSGQLSRGTRGRIFVMYLMVGILTIVAYYALILPLDFAMGMRVDKLFAVTHAAGYMPILVQVVNLLISFLERAFVMPIYAIALLLFYTDQRIRMEGYDIERLMTQAGWATQAPIEEVAALGVSSSPALAASDAPATPAPPSTGDAITGYNP